MKDDSKRVYFLLILVFSLIGWILLLATDFAGFYLTGYYEGYRYSCLTCEYSTLVDLIAVGLSIFVLIFQETIVLNEILPEKFIKNLDFKYGKFFAILTIIFPIIGLIGFGVSYDSYEWWPETAFYSTVIVGIVNFVLFYLLEKET